MNSNNNNKLSAIIKYLVVIVLIVLPLSAKGNEKDSLLNRYEVKYSEKNNQLVIIDHLTHKTFNWGTVPNYHKDHYHFAEYHDSSLYVIRRFNTNTRDWKDELWVYSKKNSGRLLLKHQGLDFKVNPGQTLVSYGSGDTLLILDLRNNKTTKIKISTNNEIEAMIESMCWSHEKEIIWGLLTWASASHYTFFSYDYKNKSLKKYKVPTDLVSYDYNINPNLGLLAYSDYPFVVDADYQQDLVKSKKKANLYILDFNTNQKKLIKTSIAKEFNPTWLTSTTLEFNSPFKESRETIIYKTTPKK